MERVLKNKTLFHTDSGLATKVAQATSTCDWRLVWGHLGTVQGGAPEQEEEEEKPSAWDKRREQWGVIWLGHPQQLLLLARDKRQSGCWSRDYGWVLWHDAAMVARGSGESVGCRPRSSGCRVRRTVGRG